MAGAGYKLFNTGDVLTAAQVNTYLNEQTVMVFASSAARTTALSGVLAEGMVSYLQDTNAVEVYNGSAWTAVGGGGLSSPLTTKGDVWGYSTTNARIPVGANGTVLTADSAETLGVKWAAPAGATFIGVQVYNSAAQSTSNSTDFYPDFDSESWDTNAFHSTSSNTSRLTVPSGQGGKYMVYAVGGYTGNTTGYRRFTISINRTSELFNNFITPDTGSCVITFSGVVELVATDYVEVLTSQTSGGALNYLGGANYSSFGMYKIG